METTHLGSQGSLALGNYVYVAHGYIPLLPRYDHQPWKDPAFTLKEQAPVSFSSSHTPQMPLTAVIERDQREIVKLSALEQI